jgi:hypothetical protein
MPLSHKEIAAAEKMHRFVRNYEKQHRAKTYGLVSGFTISLLVSIGLIMQTHHFVQVGMGHTVGWTYLGGTLVVFSICIFALLQQKACYQNSRTILQVLEREHRDELPWSEEEKQEAEVKAHLAQVHQLEQELANKHITP